MMAPQGLLKNGLLRRVEDTSFLKYLLFKGLKILKVWRVGTVGAPCSLHRTIFIRFPRSRLHPPKYYRILRFYSRDLSGRRWSHRWIVLSRQGHRLQYIYFRSLDYEQCPKLRRKVGRYRSQEKDTKRRYEKFSTQHLWFLRDGESKRKECVQMLNKRDSFESNDERTWNF